MNRLLRLLQDGRFHSGEELGRVLNVSRSSIWKDLQRIERDYALRIYKVRGRGYCLAEPLSLLESEKLDAWMKSRGWGFYLHESVDSTNAEALRLLQLRAVAPFVVMAEAQTAGRGRRGRQWISPVAENLYYSLVLKVVGGPQQLSGMSLVVGLAVLQALREFGVADVGLKWPNDVYAGGKKLAGILLELTGDPADICHVVIGVGINTNMLSSSDAIDQPWTSVRARTGKLVDRNALTLALCGALEGYLRRHREEGFAGLQAEWQASHIWQGRICRLSAGAEEIVGEVLGVDSQGALRLRVAGKESVFSGGELSLRLDHDS